MSESTPLHAAQNTMRSYWKIWQQYPAKEKNTYTAIAVAVCIALYFGLVWPVAYKRLTKLEYDLGKQAIRERATAKNASSPPPPPPSLGGKNLIEARREQEALHQQLEETRADLMRLNARFVPMDDGLAMSVLKSGLTGLAEAGDMDVLALEHVYLRSEDKDRPPTIQMIQEAAQANPFKRPLIVMRAEASYRGLMQLLDGLSSLSYIAAPVSSDISVQVERHPQTKAIIRQWLAIQIKFAV